MLTGFKGIGEAALTASQCEQACLSTTFGNGIGKCNFYSFGLLSADVGQCLLYAGDLKSKFSRDDSGFNPNAKTYYNLVRPTYTCGFKGLTGSRAVIHQAAIYQAQGQHQQRR